MLLYIVLSLLSVLFLIYFLLPKFDYVYASNVRGDVSSIRKISKKFGRALYYEQLSSNQKLFKALGNSGRRWGIVNGAYLVVKTSMAEDFDETLNQSQKDLLLIVEMSEPGVSSSYCLRKKESVDGENIKVSHENRKDSQRIDIESISKAKVIGIVENMYV